MKVILNEDIKGTGKKGDIINASDGYARNYLFPKGLAVEATEGNVSSIKAKKDSLKFKKDQEIKDAKELAKKLSGITVNFKVKAGENGKLFGSITSKDIAEEIKKQFNIDVDKKKIILEDSIKLSGVYSIEIKVYTDVSAKVKVEVLSQ